MSCPEASLGRSDSARKQGMWRACAWDSWSGRAPGAEKGRGGGTANTVKGMMSGESLDVHAE